MFYCLSERLQHNIKNIDRRSQNSYTALCNGFVSHGAQIRGIRIFADAVHAETNANKICPRYLRAVRRFARVYLYTQAAVNTHLMNHGCFDRGKNSNTSNWIPCRDKDGADSGISSM